MRSDVGQAQRPGIVDQQAEQPASLGPVVDPADLVLAQADRDEFGQPSVVTDDAQCAVGRVHQLDGGFDDPPEGGLQVQARADGDDRLEQPAHPVPGRQYGLQPGLQFGQQLVELQLRKELRPTLRFHQQSFPITLHRKTIGRPPCRLETRLAI